jgi:uncharacterized protein (TIGR03066 family)
MRPLCVAFLGVVMVVCAGNARAQDDYAKKIVAVWEISKSGGDLPVGTTIEFTKDGKLSAVIKMDGGDLKLDGTYKIAKDQLTVNVKIGEQNVEETATIKKLTDDALEIEDKDKKVDVFKKKKG